MMKKQDLYFLCGKVGSYAYDDTKMSFIASLLSYDDSLRNTILDYTIKSDCT